MTDNEIMVLANIEIEEFTEFPRGLTADEGEEIPFF